MTSNPFEEIRQILDECAAQEIMDAVVNEHRHKYLKILVHPTRHEKVRQAVCNIDPMLESAVQSSLNVKPNTAILMDTSILDKPFVTGPLWHP